MWPMSISLSQFMLPLTLFFQVVECITMAVLHFIIIIIIYLVGLGDICYIAIDEEIALLLLVVLSLSKGRLPFPMMNSNILYINVYIASSSLST